MMLHRDSAGARAGRSACDARRGRRDALAALRALLAAWLERSRQRRRLAELDAALLDDIGISHVDATREARKPFWLA